VLALWWKKAAQSDPDVMRQLRDLKIAVSGKGSNAASKTSA